MPRLFSNYSILFLTLREGEERKVLLGGILAHNARVFPGKEALVCGDHTLTYRQLEKRVTYLTSLMLEMGIRKGEPVAVLTHNSPGYIEILFSLARLGAAVSPLNFLLVPAELTRILVDLEPRILLFEKKFAETVERVRRSCPYLEKIICTDGEVPGFLPVTGVSTEAQAGDGKGGDVNENDVAMISYAGSVGKNPKGAMLSHRNLVLASYFSALEMNISRRDVYLSTAPLSFFAGTGRMLRFMLPGAKVVIMETFDPELALHLIAKHRVTQLLLVPQMMVQLMHETRKGKYDTSSLEKISYSGGIPVHRSLLEEAMAVFTCDFSQFFAQVESSGVISFLHVSEEKKRDGTWPERRLSSIGRESLGITVTSIDPEGREVLPGMVGELAVRGPTLMRGYFNDPYQTEEILRDGWLHTGCMVSIDDDGYIHLVDRRKDVILRGGIPIDPDEIEEVLSDHPAILEVAIIGKPDYEWGEVPVAILVLKEGAQVTKDDILAFASGNLASFKIPDSVEYAEQLPRNSQGKILKAKIKEDVKRGRFS